MKEINKLTKTFRQLDILFNDGIETDPTGDGPDLEYIEVGTTRFYFHLVPALDGQFKGVHFDKAQTGWSNRIKNWEKK